MKTNQFSRGQKRRVMYIENKHGLIDGAAARIGWVTFSKTSRTVYYRGKSLLQTGPRGIYGNFIELETGHEFWISGIKKRGSNAHPAEAGIYPVVDEDAQEEYERIRQV